MKEAPIIEKLLKLKEQNITSFHVPGHKNGNIYNKIPYKNFKDILYKLDTTEIPGTDNLHNAKEIIKKSQQRASEVFKSKETFFLVNGSTSGIYSIIMATTSPGDKILIDRNCHQSVINATILADLKPIYVYPAVDEKHNIIAGISPKDIEKQLKKHKDIKAVIITYPTYYGIAHNLKKIEEIVHKYDKILLIDEAHGAHLGLSKHLPPTALSCGADAVIQSTHKTLPSFTQSSMLHIQGNKIDKEKLKFMLRLHQSSSPSYLLLSSLDYAVTVYKTEGKYLMEKLIKNIKNFKQKISEIDGINIMGEEVVGNKNVEHIDITRMWINIENITGYELEKMLRENFNIQMELSNNYGTLAATSIGNSKEDFDKLADALIKIYKNTKHKKLNKKYKLKLKETEQIITPKEALYSAKEGILLKEGEGYISGEYIIPYPPGIPLVIPGEKISYEVIQQVKHIIDNGGEILGLEDDKCKWIKVIK